MPEERLAVSVERGLPMSANINCSKSAQHFHCMRTTRRQTDCAVHGEGDTVHQV